MEFVAYFFDRHLRMTDLNEQLDNFTKQRDKLYNDHATVQENYIQVILFLIFILLVFNINYF